MTTPVARIGKLLDDPALLAEGVLRAWTTATTFTTEMTDGAMFTTGPMSALTNILPQLWRRLDGVLVAEVGGHAAGTVVMSAAIARTPRPLSAGRAVRWWPAGTHWDMDHTAHDRARPAGVGHHRHCRT